MSRAIRKYGEENFLFEPLIICSSQEQADSAETYFISEYDTIKNGYNIRSGGSHGTISEETRKRMSKAQRGTKNHGYGKHRSLETKQKLSEANGGVNCHWYGKSGQQHPCYGQVPANTKLNEEKVREIKKLIGEKKLTHRAIANLYGVCQSLITMIGKGQKWPNII